MKINYEPPITENNPQPGIVAPSHPFAVPPEEAAAGRETVAMHFPHKVILTIDHQAVIAYMPGVHLIPVEWADHWYLKTNGATRKEG